jgi:hypothetical protein
LYFLTPRCLCRGYKLVREGGEPRSQKGEKESTRRLLEMLILYTARRLMSCPPLKSPGLPFIGREEAKAMGALKRCFVDLCLR